MVLPAYQGLTSGLTSPELHSLCVFGLGCLSHAEPGKQVHALKLCLDLLSGHSDTGARCVWNQVFLHCQLLLLPKANLTPNCRIIFLCPLNPPGTNCQSVHTIEQLAQGSTLSLLGFLGLLLQLCLVLLSVAPLHPCGQHCLLVSLSSQFWAQSPSSSLPLPETKCTNPAAR